MFRLQVCVAAIVNSFDPKNLHSNNLHLHVVYLLCTRCVKAFTYKESKSGCDAKLGEEKDKGLNGLCWKTITIYFEYDC